MAIISKPDNTSFTNALNHAELLRERDNDPYGVSHTLLYLSQRNAQLENIVHIADEYIRFGEDALLHAKLVKALDDFEKYEQEASLDEKSNFGLD